MMDGYDLPARPAQTKSRIKNQLCGPDDLRRIVYAFRGDLLALTLFQTRVVNDEDPYRWQIALEQAQPELERLRDTLNSLVEQAESGELWSERDELQEAIREMYQGVPVEEYISSGVFDGSGDALRDAPSPEELVETHEEQRTRRKELQTVLNTEELPTILEYIGEHGRCELPERQISGDGEPWSRVASRELVPELATKHQISNRRIKYELSDRGEAVLRAWLALKDTQAVEMTLEVRDDGNIREVVLELLAKYFSHWEK